MGRLTDRVYIVTGGGTGIGLATAQKLAQEGAKVVIGNRNADKGASAVASIQDEGGQAAFRRTDVTIEQDSADLVKFAIDTYGRLDGAFNNAGIEGKTALLPDHPEDDYDAIFNTNVKGVWFALKHQIPQLLKNGGGSIVVNASVAGLIGFPQHGIYAASKHAVIGLAKSAALEYGAQGVRTNVVSPAVIETDMFDRLAGSSEAERKQTVEAMTQMHPIGRFGKPHEIADTVAWLLSDESSFVLGQSINVDGGFTAI